MSVFKHGRNIHKMTGASQSSKDLQTAQSQVIVEVDGGGVVVGIVVDRWNEPFGMHPQVCTVHVVYQFIFGDLYSLWMPMVI